MPDKLYRDFRALGSPFLGIRPAPPSRRSHCCEHMTAAVTHICDQHDSIFDCPDNLVVYDRVYDEYGLIVHDGGPSSVQIRYCPWCGAKLPQSKRDDWFDALERAGITDPWSDDIPEHFKSNAWWQLDEPSKRT